MVLINVVFEIALAVLVMLVTATLVIVGPKPVLEAVRNFRWRLEAVLVPVIALLAVLLARWATQDIAHDVSWRLLGVNVTPYLFQLEHLFFGVSPVVLLQSIRVDVLTSYFVFVYIYGYAFLLLFPFLAYFALEEMDDLSTLVFAFTINYAIGLLLYVVFIAYGPRNLDPWLFEDVLYGAFPQSGFLTHTVNHNTNVFPSLHTSMAMTVFFLAIRTREKYPLWVPTSGVLAISVVISTMYLGIHWFSDVVAGVGLALLSVYVATNYTVEETLETGRLFVTGLYLRLQARLGK